MTSKENISAQRFSLAQCSRLQSIMTGKAGEQGLQANGHSAPAAGKQSGHAHVHLTLVFCLYSRTSAQEMVLPTVKVKLLTSINITNAFPHTPGGLSPK